MGTEEEKQAFLEGISGLYQDKEYFITGEEFVIGRAPECNLIMKESTISARHAKIVHKGSDFEIIDLGSTNGTYVNGTKVERKRLRTADKISFDVQEFTFVNPLDVVRTEFSQSDKTIAIKETLIRPQSEPRDNAFSGEKTQPLPEKEVMKPLKIRKKGKPFIGLILGLMVSFLISGGGVLISTWLQEGKLGSSLLHLFRDQIAIFPLIHLHTTWMNIDQWTLATAISVLCLPLALLVGGIISQFFSGQNRFKTAFCFSLGYVLLAALAQLVVLKMDFGKWINIFLGCGLGIFQPIFNLLAVMGYFFAVSFLFSLIGTRISRKVTP